MAKARTARSAAPKTPPAAREKTRTTAAAPPPAAPPTVFGQPLPLALPPAPDKGPTFDDALRARLRFLADKPPTARTLFEMEQTAALGVKLLALTADPMALGRQRRMTGGMMMGNGGSMSNDDDDNTVMAPSPAAETFASNMIREVVSGLAAVNAPRPPPPPSLFELLNGIKEARRSKMPEVEAALLTQLQSQYGGNPAESEPGIARQKTPRKKSTALSPRP